MSSAPLLGYYLHVKRCVEREGSVGATRFVEREREREDGVREEKRKRIAVGEASTKVLGYQHLMRLSHQLLIG